MPEIETGKDLAGDCSFYDVTSVSTSRSFHVVSVGEEFGLTLFLRALVLPDSGDSDSYCEIVDNLTTVSLVNNVGLVPKPDQPADRDQMFIEKNNIDGECCAAR